MHQIRTIEKTEEAEKADQRENKVLTQEQVTATQKFPQEVLHLYPLDLTNHQ